MRRSLPSLSLILTVLLAACSAATPPAPTAAPAAQATSALAPATAAATTAPTTAPAPTAAGVTTAPKPSDVTAPQAIAGGAVPCTMPLPATEIEGVTITCGTISVPEDWENLASTPLTITYAIQRSTSESPFADPVLFFSGGPGFSILSAIGSPNFDFSYFRANRDVIIFDQRGNRFSSDLRCPEEVRNPDPAALDAAIAAFPPYIFTAESDPAEAVSHYSASPRNAYLANCASYFRDQGRDLREYTTRNTVRDTLALMRQLGYPAYNLFGISYGTNIVLEVLDYYEQSTLADLPAVRTALIDGVFPPNIPQGFLDSTFSGGLAILRIFTACEADAACAAAYPNIRQRLIALLAQLEATPLALENGEQLTADSLSSLFGGAIFFRRQDIVSLMPRMIAELETGNTATYKVVTGLFSGAVASSQPQTAETPLDPLASEVASVAGELRALANRLDKIGEESAGLKAALSEAKTLPELYLLLLKDGLTRATPNEREAFAEGISLYISDAAQRTRQGLLDLSRSLPEPTVAEQLASVVSALSDVDVAQVFASVTDADFVQPLIGTEDFFSQAVLCNDRIAYTDLAVFQGLLRTFEAPQLLGSAGGIPNAIAACRLFGLGEANTSAPPPGVVSAVPTLVFNGALDIQTPAEWGELAFQTLTNAQMVMFPGAGHGSTRYSDCARDIAVAFVTYPEAPFSQTCVSRLRPPFVLPDAPLP